MKTRKSKNMKKLWILVIVVSILLMAGAFKLWISTDSGVISHGADLPSTIGISSDKVHFADIRILNGTLSKNVLKKGRNAEIELLDFIIDEIEAKETLPLIAEPELGHIVKYQIPKNDSDYIYAVARYFENYGFETNIK